MAIEISSKSELLSLASSLKSEVSSVKGSISSIQATLNKAEDYDGIDVTGPANILIKNLENVVSDMETASANISNYATKVNELDTDDYDVIISGNEAISLAWYDSAKDGFDGNRTTSTMTAITLENTPSNTTGADYSTDYSTTITLSTGNSDQFADMPAMWAAKIGDEVYYPAYEQNSSTNESPQVSV